MREIEIKDIHNAAKGMLTLPEIFGSEVSPALVHKAVISHLANQRQGTHATKTRGMVRGGGKKPFKQKKTGRARSGSSRSPLWRGGGIIFGPQPRDYDQRLPKGMRRAALSKALSMKLADGEIIVLDSLSFAKPQTREMMTIIRNLGLEGKSALFIIAEKDENVLLSVRNIPAIEVARVIDLNAYQVVAFDMLVFTAGAIARLTGEEVRVV